MKHIYLLRLTDENKSKLNDYRKSLDNTTNDERLKYERHRKYYDLNYSGVIIAAENEKDALNIAKTKNIRIDYTNRTIFHDIADIVIDDYITIYDLGTVNNIFINIKDILYIVDADYEQGLECGKCFIDKESNE